MTDQLTLAVDIIARSKKNVSNKGWTPEEVSHKSCIAIHLEDVL